MGKIIYILGVLIVASIICTGLGIESDGGMTAIAAICFILPGVIVYFNEQAEAEEQNRIAEEERMRREQLRKEKERLTAMNGEIKKIIQTYQPVVTPIVSTIPKDTSKNSIYKNSVLNLTVKRYKELNQSLFEEMQESDSKLKDILFCSEWENIEAQYDYLKGKMEDLEKLKSASDMLHNQLSAQKISLLNEDEDVLQAIRNSLVSLRNSLKCVFEDGTDASSFIPKEKPKELQIFEYKSEPGIVYFNETYYCLFSSTILVFDNEGVFMFSLKPEALNIVMKRETINLQVWEKYGIRHSYVDDDSNCIEWGEDRYTWLHTCIDGSPDMRYKHNPMYVYRNNIYEYVKLNFYIEEREICLIASSKKVSETFDDLIAKYI